MSLLAIIFALALNLLSLGGPIFAEETSEPSNPGTGDSSETTEPGTGEGEGEGDKGDNEPGDNTPPTDPGIDDEDNQHPTQQPEEPSSPSTGNPVGGGTEILPHPIIYPGSGTVLDTTHKTLSPKNLRSLYGSQGDSASSAEGDSTPVEAQSESAANIRETLTPRESTSSTLTATKDEAPTQQRLIWVAALVMLAAIILTVTSNFVLHNLARINANLVSNE